MNTFEYRARRLSERSCVCELFDHELSAHDTTTAPECVTHSFPFTPSAIMEDQELQAIRAARLQQLQQQNALPSGAGDAEGGGGDPEAAAAQRRTEEEMKRTILTQVLEPAARERLSRISLVSPARSQQIENNLIRMARSGMQRITDEQFLNLLKQADEAQSSSNASKIVFQRRKDFDSDDDFDL